MGGGVGGGAAERSGATAARCTSGSAAVPAVVSGRGPGAAGSGAGPRTRSGTTSTATDRSTPGSRAGSASTGSGGTTASPDSPDSTGGTDSTGGSSSVAARCTERWATGRAEGRRGGRGSSGNGRVSRKGVPRPAPSASISPPGAVSVTAWVIAPVKPGEDQLPGAKSRLRVGIAVATWRWIGGRKAHPIGAGAGGEAGAAAPAAGGDAAPGPRRQGQDQPMGQRSSFSRSLIAPISWTKRSRCPCSRSRIASGGQWKW
nr:hypothetical protein [Nocardioides humi]